MSLKDDLIKYADAYFPIIYVNTFEELKTDNIIRDALSRYKGLEWNGAKGFVDFDTKSPLFEEKLELTQTLSYLVMDNELDRKFLVLKDAAGHLEDQEVIALLKNIALRISKGFESIVIIVSSVIKIPKELEKFITITELEYPDQFEIKSRIKRFSADNDIYVSDELLEEMSISFKGLTEFEIESLLSYAIAKEGDLTRESIKLIFTQKRQMIMKSGILDMVPLKERPEDIGGLENLKNWLRRKAKVFRAINKAMEFGVDMPKGVLIAGIPGCGKSITAKATAQLFGVPLLKLDMGKIMGKYLGESETNMRKAIRLAETIAPCVLWVDELEKAFAGTDGSGHEVTMRLFANFLTWLQEKTSPVFVVATANDISKMPPELLRKGRFDDIFYVDLPNDEERKNIFDIHIRKRRKADADRIDYGKLVSKTRGFSGADIESVVVEAVENAFTDGMSELTTEYIERIISNTKSLSVIMKDKLDELRKFYKDKSNFRSAT